MALGAANVTGYVLTENTERKPVKFAKAAIAASTTDGAVVAAVASKKIRVLGFILSPATTATAVTFTTKPGGAGTAISAVITTLAGAPFSSGFTELGHFETAAGEGLSATTGTGSTVGIEVTYVEI